MSLGNSETEEFFASATAVITFLGCFIYAISEYGLLLGGGLGWIPSLIIAVIAYYFVSIFGKAILYIVTLIIVLLLLFVFK
jgi:hypothetical protein